MSQITGFGTAFWGMMGADVSFPLEGTKASVTIRPANPTGQKPLSYSNVKNNLSHGQQVTIAALRKALPNFSQAVWSSKPASFATSVECFAETDGLRVNVVEHLDTPVPTDAQKQAKFKDVQKIAQEFQSMF